MPIVNMYPHPPAPPYEAGEEPCWSVVLGEIYATSPFMIPPFLGWATENFHVFVLSLTFVSVFNFWAGWRLLRRLLPRRRPSPEIIWVR
jgi:hypothetical protein